MAAPPSEPLPELLQRMRSAHADLKGRLTTEHSVKSLHNIASLASEYAAQVASQARPPAVETPVDQPPKPQPPEAAILPPPPAAAILPPPPPVRPPPQQQPPQQQQQRQQRPQKAARPREPEEPIPADLSNASGLDVGNIPAGWGSERVNLYLNKHKVYPVAVTKEEGATTALATFATSGELVGAFNKLPRQEVLGKRLTVCIRFADAAQGGLEGDAEGPRGEKRKGASSEWREAKKARVAAGEGRRDIRDAVCPWWARLYEDQLKDKAGEVAQQLARVTREVQKQCTKGTLPQWAKDRAGLNRHGGRCAPLLGILRSPQLEGYRNKSEFTCGKDGAGVPSVGFQLGLYREGYMTVEDGSECRHISPTALAYAAILQQFIRSHSQLPVWDKKTSSGFWRAVTVREGRNATFLPPPGCTNLADATAPPFAELDPLKWLVDVTGDVQDGFPVGMALRDVEEAEVAPPPPEEVLLMLQIHPGLLEGGGGAAQVEAELKALQVHIREEEARQGRSPAVLLLQHNTGVSNAAAANAALLPFPSDTPPTAEAPPPALHDTLCDLRFRISPMAFFQVNSPTACLLYRLAGQWLAASSSTLLLDICCGTGTIGLTLARSVDRVVGIDIIESAVDDARANARLNDISNCEFIAGKAEDELPKLLEAEAAKYESVVAIVDPPRAGLHKAVLKNLLKCSQIKRLVYVSCNPSSLADNLTTLCLPPRYGDAYIPFRPVQAMAVDLFPHTKHVEGVVLLERE